MMPTSLPVIAIDGPAASGKSSTAAAVAAALDLTHIDSGSLYRTLTWMAVRDRLADPSAIIAVADAAGIALVPEGRSLAVRVAGQVVEDAIRSDPVTAHVSVVAAMPTVRDWVNHRLRDAVVALGGGVMDGRDIGTVVFPDAPLKVFLTASPAARADRRLRQRSGGSDPAPEILALEAAALTERDRLDAERAVAPLRQDPGALVLDTTTMSFPEQVSQIVAWASGRGLRRP